MYEQLPDGTVVEAKAMELVRELYDRFPTIRIQFLDPARNGDPGAAPYRAVEKGKDGLWHEVLAIWELDERVITDLYTMQFFGGKELQSRLEAEQAKADKEREDREREYLDETHDMAAHVLRSRKSSYRIDTGAGVKKLDLW